MATLGYTTIGGSTQNFFNANQAIGVPLTVPSDFSSLVSISSYGNANSGTVGVKGFITNGSGTILTNGIAPALTATTTPGWWTNTYVTPPTLHSGDSIFLCLIVNGNYIINLDSPGGMQSFKDNSNNYTTPTNPVVTVDNGSLYSLYLTYITTSGGTVTNITSITNISTLKF